ncbi:MAG: ABC transporter permease [Thermomicrobiales bacterium]
MTRSRYIIRRLIQMIPVVIGITVIIFVMLRAIPGDPADSMLGEKSTNEQRALMRKKLGLDEPIYVQYSYFVRDLFTFDLGDSLKYRQPVNDIIWDRLKVSLTVVGVTAFFLIVITVPLGILAALKKNSIIDNAVRAVLTVTMVMPTFYSGILLIIIFSIKLDLLPVSGYGDSPLDHLKHVILPSLTLALVTAPYLIRILRASILDALNSDYVTTARSKGLEERRVISLHVLRNALIPTVTLFGITIGGLMGGTVITEKVFALPGAGALLIESVQFRDYPTVQAATFIFAIMVITINLIVDIVYSFLDPRVVLS